MSSRSQCCKVGSHFCGSRPGLIHLKPWVPAAVSLAHPHTASVAWTWRLPHRNLFSPGLVLGREQQPRCSGEAGRGSERERDRMRPHSKGGAERDLEPGLCGQVPLGTSSGRPEQGGGHPMPPAVPLPPAHAHILLFCLLPSPRLKSPEMLDTPRLCPGRSHLVRPQFLHPCHLPPGQMEAGSAPRGASSLTQQ